MRGPPPPFPPDVALRVFHQSVRRLEKDPSDSQIKLRLADAVRRSGDLARAESLYREVIGASEQDKRP